VLTTGRSQLLGLVVPDLQNPYFSAPAEAVEAAAKEQGLGLVLAQARSEDLPELVESLSGRLVAGIITATLPPRRLPRSSSQPGADGEAEPRPAA
jgi:LacI family transcriptional regulator